MKNNKVLDILTAFVKEKLESSPACHDWEHTKRVLRNALIISESESSKKPDLDIVKAAALLHDIARAEDLFNEGKICHAELGAKMVPDILKHLNLVDIDAEKVANCVLRHRYRNKQDAPQTIEEKIVFDADKLDSLGAVGVARAIHFSGRIGSALHNTKEVALSSKEYSKQDSAYREYLVKLRYIPERMMTESGKAMAIERFEFMRIFFERINLEVYGTKF